MITRKEIDLAAPLTTPQIEMLTALAASPSTADVDCPELMAAQQNSFHRIIRKRNPALSQVTQIHRKVALFSETIIRQPCHKSIYRKYFI